jgi:RecA-family ATPase
MLIRDILPERSLTCVAGAMYTGKTFFALETARAIAFNRAFMHHWDCLGWGNVLLIEADSPEYDTGRALYAMLRDDMEHLMAQANGAARIEALKISWHPFLNLQLPDAADLIAATALSLKTSLGYWGKVEHFEEGCQLIIMDTFRRLHLADEDSSTEMNKVMFQIDRIRQKSKAAIMLLHHEPKNPGRSKVRGSTVIEGNCDNIFRITKDKKRDLSRVTVEKLRAVKAPDFYYSITDEDDRKEVRFHSYVQGQEEKPDNLLTYISGNGPITAPMAIEWGTYNNVSKSTIYRRLRQLTADGRITKEGDTYNA